MRLKTASSIKTTTGEKSRYIACPAEDLLIADLIGAKTGSVILFNNITSLLSLLTGSHDITTLSSRMSSAASKSSLINLYRKKFI